MMRQYDATNLVVHPGNAASADVIVEVTPAGAGWDYINFQARRLSAGQTWTHATSECELALVLLGGRLTVTSAQGTWALRGREHVFAGPPHALYLPRRTTFQVHAESDTRIAVAWVAAEQDHPPRLISPEDVAVEIRGGDNATRQINNIIPPGFDCQRLVVVEVYTPGGSWSSYPPHKHDIHKLNPDGSVREADLEEVYFYQFEKPEAYAYQRVYTDPESPLHQAGYPIDALVLARDSDVVLIPEGYHPVVSPPGYTTYYLNVLAGSAQSLANTDDPQYAWVKESYTSRDPRVPIYEIRQK
jgi:5-deoxy-glucuronate isomerase